MYKDYVADIHAKIGKDAYGYSLSYFNKVSGVNNDDYLAIWGSNNAVANDFEADASASPAYMTDAPNLFNGNIKRMVTTFTDIKPGSPTIGQALPQITAYKYDQLNRIAQLKAYRDINVSTNVSGAATSNAYLSTMSYDANGNLLTMNVNGEASNLGMDQLQYKYDWYDVNDPSKGKRSNRLYHIKDPATSTYTTDIDDPGTNFVPYDPLNPTNINTMNTYGYDELGNLKRDNQENISQIDWTVYGKIKSIQRSVTTKPTLDFTYDANGNRVSKISTLNGVLTGTYYVRDASGNIMATYDYNKTSWASVPTVTDYSLYGSSRVGTATGYASFIKGVSVYSRVRKNKNYELSNHLGNVLAVVSDKRQPHTSNGTTIDYYDPTVLSTQDYYAFGAPMPGRGFTPSTSTYRYGFNGKEKDDEVVGNGNEYDYGFRIYNPRLGRFLSVDPLTAKYPHYSPYHFAGNKPIVAMDLDGKEDIWVHFRENQDGSFQEVIREYAVKDIQREAISGSMNGATIPNTGVVYTFDHVDGSKEVRKVGETVTVSAFRDNIFIRGAKSGERFMTAMQGNSYGEGEDWIKSSSAGGKASLSFNKYSIGIEGGIYSTGENNAGLYLNLNFDVTAKNGTEGLNLTDFVPDASASLFIKANTGNEFDKKTVTNSTTLSGEGNFQVGPIGLGGSADVPLNGEKASGSFEIDFGKGKTGASGKVKNSTTIQFKTETKDLGGH